MPCTLVFWCAIFFYFYDASTCQIYDNFGINCRRNLCHLIPGIDFSLWCTDLTAVLDSASSEMVARTEFLFVHWNTQNIQALFTQWGNVLQANMSYVCRKPNGRLKAQNEIVKKVPTANLRPTYTMTMSRSAECSNVKGVTMAFFPIFLKIAHNKSV